jgi:hypothetical protein
LRLADALALNAPPHLAYAVIFAVIGAWPPHASSATPDL